MRGITSSSIGRKRTPCRPQAKLVCLRPWLKQQNRLGAVSANSISPTERPAAPNGRPSLFLTGMHIIDLVEYSSVLSSGHVSFTFLIVCDHSHRNQ